MQAYCKKIDGLYWVCLAGQTVTSYSAKINAQQHAQAINNAINNPSGLNQHPTRTGR